jgi:hypothetical protein
MGFSSTKKRFLVVNPFSSFTESAKRAIGLECGGSLWHLLWQSFKMRTPYLRIFSLTPCTCPSGQEKRSRPSCELLKCVVPKQEICAMQPYNIMNYYSSDHEFGLIYCFKKAEQETSH